MKTIVFISLAMLLVACVKSPHRQDVIFEQNVGWLHGNCLAIKNSTLSLPKAFTLYEFDSENGFTTAILTKKATSGDECYALLDDRKQANLASGYSFYNVKSESPINIGIGFFKLGITDPLEFNYCTTTEGIVFSILESNSTLWEEYYYLGYESEATCE